MLNWKSLKKKIGNDIILKEFYDDFLNLEEYEAYFLKNTHTNFNKKYKDKLYGHEMLGAQIEDLSQNVVKKIDLSQKLNF